MFDKTTIVHNKEKLVPYEKSVTINRAPTDESVALLNEMQEKAIKNLVKTVEVKDNTMNATVLYFLHGFGLDAIKFIAKFSFNGKEYQLEGQVSRRDLLDSHPYGNQDVANAIALKLCELMIQELFKGFGVEDLKQIRSGMML